MLKTAVHDPSREGENARLPAMTAMLIPGLVDGRRKKLFPNLRRFVVDYDLQVSEGRVARNVLSESMSAQ